MEAIVHIETPRRSPEHRRALEESLYALPGVAAVRADTTTSVLFDDELVDIGEIADELRGCGFPARRIVFRRLP